MTGGFNTILVTGGAGYIGSHIALELLQRGCRVVVVDNLSEGRRELVPEAAIFVEGCAGDRALVAEAMRAHGVEAVVHCAGSIRVPESVSLPLKYYDNNVGQTVNLLQACVDAGIRAFLFSSTASVYGIPDRIPITEDTPCLPVTPYGHSKHMVECILADVAAAHGMAYCAMRYFNVAGADLAGRSGMVYKATTNLIKVACEVAVGRRDELTLYGTDYETPDGTAIRDFIHVSDLAAAHVAALDHLARQGGALVVNCGYGRGLSVKQIIDGMNRLLDRPLPVRIAGRRAGDPPILIAEVSRIREILDWTPRHDDLDAILGSALAWERRLLEM